MSITVPNFGALRSKNLQHSAERIVERIDFGRQRAVMTGIPHRLAIDLDAGTYKLEWQGEGARDEALQSNPKTESVINPKFSLAPPPETKRSYQTLLGPLGKLERLRGGIEFGWVETPGGDVDFGEVFIDFEGDGTSSYTIIVLDDPDGRELALEILPLADAVRILDEES